MRNKHIGTLFVALIIGFVSAFLSVLLGFGWNVILMFVTIIVLPVIVCRVAPRHFAMWGVAANTIWFLWTLVLRSIQSRSLGETDVSGFGIYRADYSLLILWLAAAAIGFIMSFAGRPVRSKNI